MYKSILYKPKPVGYSYHHYSTNIFSKKSKEPKGPKESTIWMIFLFGFYLLHKNH